MIKKHKKHVLQNTLFAWELSINLLPDTLFKLSNVYSISHSFEEHLFIIRKIFLTEIRKNYTHTKYLKHFI